MDNADLIFQHALDRLSLKGIEGLSELDRDIVTLWHLEAGMNNGGFIHYYSGHGGDLAFGAPGALQRIGAVGKTSILSSVNALFGPSGPSREKEERLSQIKLLSAQSLTLIDVMEERYYQDTDDVDELVESYVGKEKR